jgi:hypothetical protein
VSINPVRLGRGMAAVLAALLLSGGGGCEQAKREGGRSAPPAASVSETALRTIDGETPAIAVPIDARAQASDRGFVAVEVREVVNPRRVPLTFEVRFQPAGGDAVRLGEFSLFPADNPGRFIVATQGRIRGPGSIVVSLAEGDRAAARDVRIGISEVALADR